MSERAPDRKCWELNDSCPMRGQPRSGSACPAYRRGYSCWEFDWKSFVMALPPEKWDYWKAILEQCDTCVVYRMHTAEMKPKIDEVRSL